MISADLLDEVVRRLSHFQPQRIILFGSQARGSADERSDVDILVIGDFAANRTEAALAMDRTLRGLKLARDVIVMTPEEFERDRDIPGTLARPAAKEGRVLYERAA
jgi:uncharacterized protein